jgi:hypothetical protein
VTSQRFSTNYSFDEMLSVTWLTIRKRWIWKGAARYILAMTLVMAAILEVSAKEHSFEGIIANVVTGMVVGMVGLAITALYWLWCIPRTVRKSYNQMALEKGTIEFSFDDQQLTIADATTTLKLPWERWIKWAEDTDFLLLYRTDLQAHYVAKKQVRADLVGAIKAHLNGAGVKRF